jgi:hypothetical protein
MPSVVFVLIIRVLIINVSFEVLLSRGKYLGL